MEQVKERNSSALALLSLAVVLFATVWPAMKFALAQATPVWFAAGRAGLGALASLVLLAALGRLRCPARQDLPIILTIGGLQLALYFALCLLALAVLPAGRFA